MFDIQKTLEMIFFDLPTERVPDFVDEKGIDAGRIDCDPIWIKKIFYKLVPDYPYQHSKVLDKIMELRKEYKEFIGVTGDKSLQFVIRVDDFPRWDMEFRRFKKFHQEIMADIPYLLGVTPFVCKKPLDPYCNKYRTLDQDEIYFLKKNENIRIAMHGITHQVKEDKKSELVGTKEDKLRSDIERGLSELRENSFDPSVFIPTFNSIDFKSYNIVKNYFKIITGGPESVEYLGYKLSPSILQDCLYIPSYKPAYGKADELITFVEKVKKIEETMIIPLTIHWAWEEKEDYDKARKLINLIENKTIDWRNLFHFH